MKRIHAVAVGVVAGLSLAVAAATFAQPFGGMGPGHGATVGVDPATRIDTRLGEMKAQLNITPAQESAWQSFTTAARQQAAEMQALRSQMQQDPGTAPDRMGQRATMMQQRSAAMATMTNAFNALYVVLTPEQKAIADQNFGMTGHSGMRFGPRAS
jgi:Spy/CpxP family protein refolding chaperone